MKSNAALPMVTSEEAVHNRHSQHSFCQPQLQLSVLNLAAEQQRKVVQVVQCRDKTVKGQAAAFIQRDYG